MKVPIENIRMVSLLVLLILIAYFNFKTATKLSYITGLIKSKSTMESLDKIHQVWGFDTTINNQRIFVTYVDKSGKWLRVEDCGSYDAIIGNMSLDGWMKNENLNIVIGVDIFPKK